MLLKWQSCLQQRVIWTDILRKDSPMKKTIFTGVGTAIATPMNADGSINYDEFGRMLEFQAARTRSLSAARPEKRPQCPMRSILSA